jgi:hypothetical protein
MPAVLVEGEPFAPQRQFLGYVVPLSVAAHPDLSQLAKHLYGRLAMYAGKKSHCNPGLNTLAADLGSSEDAIGRALAELKSARLIRRRRMGPNRAECGMVWNEILRPSLRCKESAELRIQPQGNDSAETRSPDSGQLRNQEEPEKQTTPQKRGRDSAFTPRAIRMKRFSKEINTRTAQKNAQCVDSDFSLTEWSPKVSKTELAAKWFDEEFWPAYPRKVARCRARKLAVAIATTEAARTEIMIGLRRHLPKYAQTEERFIPHPTTWLNEERWKDEVAPQPISPAPAITTPNQLSRYVSR